jgi:hypothetical protein
LPPCPLPLAALGGHPLAPFTHCRGDHVAPDVLDQFPGLKAKTTPTPTPVQGEIPPSEMSGAMQGGNLAPVIVG